MFFKSFRPCALDESNLSIGRVNILLLDTGGISVMLPCVCGYIRILMDCVMSVRQEH